MIQYAVAWQKDSDNLGDDLRTLAAMELLPRVDRVLDAGRLDMPLSDLGEDDRVAALLCGSVLKESAHWLPDGRIAPVCVGIHASAEDVWGIPFCQLDGAGLAYLRSCAPVYCRDERTCRLMEQAGIPCELTGCVTLTLRRPEPDGQAEPPYACCVDIPPEAVTAVREFAAGVEVRELSHHNPTPDGDFQRRMEAARALVRIYAGARFVITRRLHCAMACLALGTPVLLLYNGGYEDVTRFAPMDGMVHTLPVKEFLRRVRGEGLAPWTNPPGVEAWQDKLRQAVQAGLAQAERMPLPIVPAEAAEAWRIRRLRQVAMSSAGKIHRLESEQLTALHEKFTLLMREDNAKAVLCGILEEPEVRRGMEKAARRRMLSILPWYRRPWLWLRLRTGHARAEDLYALAREQLRELGWPEAGE